ncbi:hypothetical protein [Micromonospora sp. NBC_01796]|uniref:hypothetical protein n=1 Tax=Micromonospora sp. NBC_01796 TaxID=2975987 RepID=UPI002DD9F8B0|nr:hypothetical protein [Micromonospora sp. NBC_01796]WSA88861.1 hypothetical protein OIE47_15325 [Micromonospora sp. NBC_01796]
MLSRRLLTVGAMATLVLALGLTGSASARDPGADCPPSSTNCDVWDDIPGNPDGPGGGGPGGGGGGNDGPARKCVRDGVAVTCYDDVLGWFNPQDGCYYKVAEPQPDEVPEGKTLYQASCAEGGLIPRLLDGPPPGFGAPPDPGEMAAELLASLTLKNPRVGIAPHPSKGAGLVGLPVWLWTDPGAETWGPQVKSKSDRGITVRIEASVDRMVWNMGNGDKVTCTTHGRAYVPATDKDTKPPCGYANGYSKPSGDNKYKVSGTTYWVVPWRVIGGGASGTLTTQRNSAEVEIEIDELQVVTR